MEEDGALALSPPRKIEVLLVHQEPGVLKFRQERANALWVWGRQNLNRWHRGENEDASGGPCAPAPGGWWAESQLLSPGPSGHRWGHRPGRRPSFIPSSGSTCQGPRASLTFQTQGPRILWGNLLHPQRWLACSRAPELWVSLLKLWTKNEQSVTYHPVIQRVKSQPRDSVLEGNWGWQKQDWTLLSFGKSSHS